MEPVFPTETRELRRSRDIRRLKWDYVVGVFKEAEHTRPAPTAASESHQSSKKSDHSHGRHSRPHSRGHSGGHSALAPMIKVKTTVVFNAGSLNIFASPVVKKVTCNRTVLILKAFENIAKSSNKSLWDLLAILIGNNII